MLTVTDEPKFKGEWKMGAKLPEGLVQIIVKYILNYTYKKLY